MPLSDSDIRALEPKDNRFRVAIGYALHIEVYPKGGKYFVSRIVIDLSANQMFNLIS